MTTTIAIISSQAFSLVNFRGPLIRELAAQGIGIVALAPDYTPDVRSQVQELGAQTLDYSLNRAGTNPMRDVVDMLRLARLLRQIRPQVALGYFAKPVVFGTIAAWLARVPLRIAMIEGLGYAFMRDETAQSIGRKLLRGIASGLYRFALGKAGRVILLNQDDIEDLCAAGVLDASKAILIRGIGVDLDAFSPVPAVTEPVTFVLVARLLREKGVYDFVEAARRIHVSNPDARFVLVGDRDANPGSVSTEQLTAWQSEGVIRWTGSVPDVRPHLAAASVFVLPSYYREGVPRSTQEAMAMGRPVITTDAPGCRETVDEGVNGFLVPPRSPGALVQAMQRFIAQPSLITTMGAASRRMAEERFDVRVLNRQLLAAIAPDR